MSPTVADELEIGQLVAQLSTAGDEKDASAYRACLFDWVDTTPLDELADLVRGDDYARRAMERLALADWTHHRPATPLLFPRTRPDRVSGVADFVVEIGWTDAQGRGRMGVIGGRSHLGFIRTSGRWLICARSKVWRYRLGDPFPEDARNQGSQADAACVSKGDSNVRNEEA